MYLYIDLEDLTHYTSTSGIVVSGTLEFAGFNCGGCSGESLEIVTVGQGSMYDGLNETAKMYDALMVCLDCGNEFWLRQNVVVL